MVPTQRQEDPGGPSRGTCLADAVDAPDRARDAGGGQFARPARIPGVLGCLGLVNRRIRLPGLHSGLAPIDRPLRAARITDLRGSFARGLLRPGACPASALDQDARRREG